MQAWVDNDDTVMTVSSVQFSSEIDTTPFVWPKQSQESDRV